MPPADRPHVTNPAFDAEIMRLLRFTVPVMEVGVLKSKLKETTVFDAREKAEYNISHIPGAKYLGFKDFDQKLLDGVPKDKAIVVYCSVGYRSEKISEKLQKLGYTKVYNLYGSIFEWANRGFPLVKSPGKTTLELHTFDEKWAKWVVNPKIVKVW